jgi:hypothetical protein
MRRLTAFAKTPAAVETNGSFGEHNKYADARHDRFATLPFP